MRQSFSARQVSMSLRGVKSSPTSWARGLDNKTVRFLTAAPVAICNAVNSPKRLPLERGGAADGEPGLGKQTRVGGVPRPIENEDDVARFFGHQLFKKSACASPGKANLRGQLEETQGKKDIEHLA